MSTGYRFGYNLQAYSGLSRAYGYLSTVAPKVLKALTAGTLGSVEYWHAEFCLSRPHPFYKCLPTNYEAVAHDAMIVGRSDPYGRGLPVPSCYERNYVLRIVLSAALGIRLVAVAEYRLNRHRYVKEP